MYNCNKTGKSGLNPKNTVREGGGVLWLYLRVKFLKT